MRNLFVGLCLLALAGTSAFAADVPKHTIDMTAVLHDETGAPGIDYFNHAAVKPGEKCTDCQPLTLGLAVSHALFAILPGDEHEPEQKWARAILAEKIKDDPKAELTAAEVSVIEKRLASVYGGVILYQAYPLLDPNRKPPEVK